MSPMNLPTNLDGLYHSNKKSDDHTLFEEHIGAWRDTEQATDRVRFCSKNRRHVEPF